MEGRKEQSEAISFSFESNDQLPRRRRSMTTLNLQWVGERVRKARKIKEQIDSGTYKVQSVDVASSMVGLKAIKK